MAFRWKDYRIKSDVRLKVRRFNTDEFICRCLIHVLPDGFHRIGDNGLLASAVRKTNIAKIRPSLRAQAAPQDVKPSAVIIPCPLCEWCPDCVGPMRFIKTLKCGQRLTTRAPPRAQGIK